MHTSFGSKVSSYLRRSSLLRTVLQANSHGSSCSDDRHSAPNDARSPRQIREVMRSFAAVRQTRQAATSPSVAPPRALTPEESSLCVLLLLFRPSTTSTPLTVPSDPPRRSLSDRGSSSSIPSHTHTLIHSSHPHSHHDKAVSDEARPSSKVRTENLVLARRNKSSSSKATAITPEQVNPKATQPPNTNNEERAQGARGRRLRDEKRGWS